MRQTDHSPLATHQVENQPGPLIDYRAFGDDRALTDVVDQAGGGHWSKMLDAYGTQAASELARHGIEANRHLPRLNTHDRYGHRVDRVDFHPSYHALMAAGIEAGMTRLSWSDQPGGRIARSALMYLHNQFEAGTMCPITMTHAAVPALQCQPDLARDWVPRILQGRYDPDFRPAEEKRGVTIGMAMTEKQGGSDVRANTTTASPIDRTGGGQPYRLRGHKWFCSAPMSDAFLSLAQTSEGLSCFLVPRWCPDGQLNGIHIQRLKDKLGNCSNASSEIEYLDAFAWMVGEPGRGVATIIKMVAETRLDCAIGSAALMRQAVAQALDHCRQRQAFGQRLSNQPLMQNVLADLALESEMALRFAFFLAGCFDRTGQDEASERIARLATPVAKYWLCKRAVHVVNEAQECLGGAGYVEEFILPRLFREAPVNAIWEGSGNIQCLDVLRAVSRDPSCLSALESWLSPVLTAWPECRRWLDQVHAGLGQPRQAAVLARRIVESLALLIQARLAFESDQDELVALFRAGRLKPGNPALFGTLDQGLPLDAMIERASPRPMQEQPR
ncbi:MAG: acyl-CoA dehydrogenase family protein [Wenzhouxiangella sp.]